MCKDWPQWWNDKRGNVRIMTVCDGYVMAMRPHKIPFVKSEADFKLTFRKGKIK